MQKHILTGLAAAGCAVLIPMLAMGLANGGYGDKTVETAPREAVTVETVDTRRKVSEIVIHQDTSASGGDEETRLAVTVEGTQREMSMEEYLTGVLMGEMPASYPLEALKAQAVAARTYTLQQLEAGKELSDDPAVCQAFHPLERAEEKLGTGWQDYLEKLRGAVRDTDGQVLTYEGELITATYFSCSGGRTESAQAVWGGGVPYLVSVDSPGEEDSAAYESFVTASMTDFLETLGVTSADISEITYTDGGGVDTVTVGGKIFTGTELRSLFSLRSTRFSLEVCEDTVEFSVRGYGHRVGLSQNGARVMAEQGSDYEEILKWYYTGVEIETWQ